MADLIYSVRNIFSTDTGYLKEGYKGFNIPIYQRGYKWTEKEVETLLEDIHKFDDKKEKFYCLQNITIVPEEKHFYYNVVDGQQRLTTLSIILSHFDEKSLVTNKIQYSIRKNTHEFLTEFVFDTNCEPIGSKFSTWTDLVTEHPNFDHQDIFYIYKASKTILTWLDNKEEEKGFSKEVFKNKILNKVQFIVNNVGEGNEEKIFGNLNSKRIPLDGADLVRAILITRVAAEENKRGEDIKGIVQVNEYRIKIGWQLDAISAWWSDENVKSFYGKLIHIKSEASENFDLENYPLNTLLALFAQKQGQKSLSLAFVENEGNATQLYKSILKLHHVLKDWYGDREIYHLIGLLATELKSKGFEFIWNLWIKEESRTKFINELKNKVFEEVYGKDFDFDKGFSHTTNWYLDEKPLLIKTLLLLDIIEVGKNKSLSVLPVSSFYKTDNDVEHIFPQTPAEKQSAQMLSFLNYLNKYVAEGKGNDIINRFDSHLWLYDEKFKDEVNAFINETTKDLNTHSIGNLVLLNSSLNRSLQNNPYSHKRYRVIKYSNEGKYVQPHTFKVFTRYFTDDENKESYDLEHWGQKDIEKNTNAIKTTITDYFKNSLEESENI